MNMTDARVESYLDAITLEDLGDDSWGEHGTYWVRDAIVDRRAELLDAVTSYHASSTGTCMTCGSLSYLHRSCDYCGEA